MKKSFLVKFLKFCCLSLILESSKNILSLSREDFKDKRLGSTPEELLRNMKVKYVHRTKAGQTLNLFMYEAKGALIYSCFEFCLSQ